MSGSPTAPDPARASAPRVWITRAAPGAQATAGRVRALGFEPLVASLLEVRPIPGPPLDLAGVAALAFTSANAVAAFVARNGGEAALAAGRTLPVFAVGAATARAAREAGFTEVISADGDVAALARLIRAQALVGGLLLHPGPREPAGDLAGELAAHGLAARALAVYETLASPPAAAIAAEIPSLAAVLLHSPRAARVLAAWLERRPAPHPGAVCLSPAVAAPLQGLALPFIDVAAAPTEAALLRRLAERLGAAPPDSHRP